MKILFTGGGTGGHIYPILAVKRTIEKYNQDVKFLYLGTDGFANRAFKKENLKCRFILTGKFRRYFSVLNFIDVFKIPIGLIQSLWHVFFFMPDVVFAKGAYGSGPVVFASWLYRIPIIIHESDIVPGLANKIVSRFAKKIIVSFEEAKKYFPSQKTIVLGNPIREEIIQGNKEEAKKIFGLNSGKPVVLIMGGSQGARRINEIVINTLPRLLEKCEVIHISGENNFKLAKAEAEKMFHGQMEKMYHLYPFLEEQELKHAYAISDVIVNRTSAGAIFEISANGKPSVLIPLSNSASDHQIENAKALAKTGGAIILDENNLTINMFLDAIFGILDNPQKAQEMGKKAKSFYKPETNQKIAEEILNYANKI